MKVKDNIHPFRFVNALLAFALLFASLFLQLAFPEWANAQVRPVNDYGALGLGRLLKRINTTASVMMIGAHPDDEDSSLLAYLARGENARTAYLSLTRGDGGQNIIGPELFESLGVIRTEELLQARRLDGAEQFFTRAFDYGFSKTLAEAKTKWDEKIIICDTVRAIRTFRPLVVISRFSGTPADGHGHHQYSGYITPLAVKAAADPKQCTDAGEPWQVLKFYVEQGFGADAAQPTLRINTGAYDAILGRSYFEIAMEGRSMHRSQGEGRIEFHGDQFSGLNLVESKVPKVEKETSPFDGLDVSVKGIATLSSNNDQPFIAQLNHLNSQASFVRHYYSQTEAPCRDGYLSPTLTEALVIESSTNNAKSKDLLREFEKTVKEAIRLCQGIQIDALSEVETVIPSDQFMVSVKIFRSSDSSIDVENIWITSPKGWTVTKADPPKQNNAAYNSREVASAGAVFNVKVDAAAKPTQPYWLENPRERDLFAWPKTDSHTLPFDPQPLIAHVKVNMAGTEITLDHPVQYRYADPSRGEIRREVNVVPAFSIGVDHDLLIVPQSDKPQTRKLSMSVTNNSGKALSGFPGVNIPTVPEWKYTFDSRAIELKTKGEKTSVSFDVTIPAKTTPGLYHIYPDVMIGEALVSSTMNTVAYPHIQTHRYYTRAETLVNVLDLKIAPVRVGYVMGSGDEVPEVIRQMGLTVTLLDEKNLVSGDLSKFDTIVIGIRATETRPDLVANNQRLLDWVKNGGTLITQYQRGNFAQRGLTPFPVDTTDKQGTAAGSIARVVDENAPVKILEPTHSVFNFPNKIGDDDFKGWVQERNAYNLVTFDPQYTPLLESHDAGEQENKGGLVLGKLGKGNYIYCSYSFFRQLPAGVSGAYRLFANILSLPQAAAPKK